MNRPDTWSASGSLACDKGRPAHLAGCKLPTTGTRFPSPAAGAAWAARARKRPGRPRSDFRKRGVSILELLVVIVIFSIVAAGATTAFSSAVQFQEQIVPEREAQLDRQRFEDNLARLLRSAYIAPDEQDATTYFVAGSSSGEISLTETASSDTIIFTVLGLPPPSTFMANDQDFESRNETFGPQGGAAEIQVSTAPVGDAGDRTGLFLREQRPSDGDPYQGGYESVLDARVASMSFEFWNGEAWQGEWDTITQGQRRLPAAIRVTYSFLGEEGVLNTFVVRLPLSDVTPDDPLGVGVGG